MKRIFLNFSNVFSSHRHRNSTYADMSDDELINCFKSIVDGISHQHVCTVGYCKAEQYIGDC